MKHGRTVSFAIISIFLLGVAVLLSFAVGARNIPLPDLMKTITGADTDSLYLPILQKRILRTVLGLIAGCALGTAGCLMQTITRNPIADPSILGVNTGASLFVVTGIAFLGIHTTAQYIVCALLGAALTAFLVFGIASFTPGGTINAGSASPIRLALSGA